MAAGIWSAVHWWDEWQLRILVLSSLGVQWFLLFAAPMRKYTVPRWFRTFIWLAYIGSDALAIYALATLFNRHARGSSCNNNGGSTALEVLWAPVLLIHLGGQEEITAYNIEDNELWTRHTVTLVSQVAVAVYAFCRSWRGPVGSGDRRLLASAVLLFVIGVLSFCEKPWAQRRACINRLAAVSPKVHGRGRRRTSSNKVNRCQSMLNELEEFVKWCWKRIPMTPSEQDYVLSDGDKVHMILSDMSLLAASSDLIKHQQLMTKQRTRSSRRIIEVEDGAGSFASCGWRRRPGGEPAADPPGDDDQVLRPLSPIAELGLKPWLRRAFGLIYTRVNVATTPTYLAYHMLLVPSLHVAAITLFATSDKRRYPGTDVWITYAVLVVTAALDVLAETIRQLLYKLMSAARVPALCETLPQYNVLSSACQRTTPVIGWLLRCAARLGLEEECLVICRRDESLYGRVAGFVMADLVGATSGSARGAKGLDLSSYRAFTAANWALSVDLQKRCCRCGPMIERSLRESFDKSVLLWHVATDLCFRRKPPPAAGSDAGKREECTRAVSHYMAHLLNSQPEMLMTGSRRHLLAEAVEDVETILKDSSSHLDEKTLLEIVQEEGRLEPPAYPLIHDACKLSDELMKLQDDGTGWEVMYRVWLGMLCYSASMCRGYLHAKSLGEGGEFLSFVWLVLSLKGAKTLVDKLQMPEHDDQESAPGEEMPAIPSIGDLESLVDQPR